MRGICILFIFFSCSSSDNDILVSNSGEAQGTYYHIKYMSDHGEDLHLQIDSILQNIDSSLSIYKEYSLISRLNNGESIKTDTLFNTVFLAAKEVFLETKGYFDCSIFPLVNEWGFYNDKIGDFSLVDSAKIIDVLHNTGFHKMQLIEDSLVMPKNMCLDFNALAQGFTVDLIASFLDEKDIRDYMIELGGEVLTKGKNDEGNIWRIGVDKPLKDIDIKQRFQFIMELENKALATSGSYRKFYEKDGVKYSHTINPFTGFPAQNNLLSVTVIHDDCMLADAYATAFMAMGVRQVKEFVSYNSDIEIYLVFSGEDGELKTYITASLLDRIIN